MAGKNTSVKHVLIDKANSSIVIAAAVASFVVIFCLVASVTLMGQLAYQNRVIGKKKTALNQLNTDLQSISSLETAYSAFENTTQNILGGNPQGTGAQDGDNAKIVLDALPSKYDFPALATSLEKILTSQNVQIQSITGTDDEVAQAGGATGGTPQAVPMPFQVSVTGDFNSVKNVIAAFQNSIRPIQVQTLELTAGGDNGQLSAVIGAQTFYQPEKTLSIKQEVVQ